MKTKVEKTDEKKGKEKIAGAECNDPDCHIHGNLKTRGKVFEGTVITKSHKRIAIGFERSKYVQKYERYATYKAKIHARLPICMKNEINIGDYVRIMECRPLSKIIHFVVIKKIRSGEEKIMEIKK